MLISVIVATFNRAEFLQDSIESLINLETQNKFEYEIIVIDNCSTDHTQAILGSLSTYSSIPLKYFIEKKKGVAFARNRGIKEAVGEWVAFFDDDQIADVCWLKELWEAAQQTNGLCIGGRVSLFLDAKVNINLPIFCRSLLGETQHGDILRQYPKKMLPGTGNVLIHNSIFNTIGSFNELYVQGSEDTDFFRRVKESRFQLWYTPKALVHHRTPPYRVTEEFLILTSLRHGVSYAFYDHSKQGLLKVVFISILRLTQAIIVKIPIFIVSLLLQNEKSALEQKCLISRSMGYFRETLFLISAKIFSQNKFFGKIRFRQEQKKNFQLLADNSKVSKSKTK